MIVGSDCTSGSNSVQQLVTVRSHLPFFEATKDYSKVCWRHQFFCVLSEFVARSMANKKGNENWARTKKRIIEGGFAVQLPLELQVAGERTEC